MVMELLAPAGSYEIFKIAVNAGSDAVYLSGKDFGARAFAENFTAEEIEQSVEYAHLNNVKVFITVNTLINNFETVKFLKYLFKLYKIGVDGVIVQDFGVLKLIKTVFPEMKIHASTQMGLNNYYSLLWASNNGVSRVIFPRELSVNEITDISSRLNESKISMELEVFVHGAICYSISGKCYISSLNNGRSGNRGSCTQPCRREYILKHDGYKIDNGYLLSTYDLNTAKNLDKIEKSGVNSIKLEGRMKSEDYVGTIVNSYRNILDNKKEFIDDLNLVFNRKFTKGYILGELPGMVMGRESSGHIGFYIGDIVDIKNDSTDYDNNVNNYEHENRDNKTNSNKKYNKYNSSNNCNKYSKTISNNNLKSNYNNNSKKSYNENRDNKKYDYNKKSNHNKLLEDHNKEENDYKKDIYRVKEVRVNKENHIDIQVGDGIAFKYKDKIKGIYLDNIIKQNEDYITFKTTRNLRVGDKVFISYSHLLHKKLKKYRKECIQSKIPISLEIHLDENLQISVKAKFSLNNDTVELNYYSPSKIQKAINRPTSLDEIKKQLSKTGNTPFFIEKIEVTNFSNNIFVPTSQLNNLRREILNETSDRLLSYYKPNKKQIDLAKNRLKSFIKNYKSLSINNKPVKSNDPKNKTLNLAVIVHNLDLVKIASSYPIKKIYFDPSYLYNNLKDYFKNIEDLLIEASTIIYINKANEAKLNKTLELVWVLPSFISDDEIDKSIKIFNNLKREGFNLSIMTDISCISHLFDCNIYGSHNLNIWNSYSCENLEESGFNSLTLSSELSYDEIKELNSTYFGDIDLELIVHGNLEVMVSFDDFSNLSNGKNLIIKNNSDYAILEDKKRKKFKYKVHLDFNKKSHIINKDCLCLIDELDKIEKLGLNSIVLDCKFSKNNYASRIISLYLEAIENTDKKKLNLLKKEVSDISHSYLSKGNFLDGRMHEKN
ncbi:MAG: DUF3656 domain-containing protein [Methanobrevibacter sp.]|jgi:putative protease|nr:DUF3656 domain-containing protein [Candidatus Methanovirga australis]